MALELAAIRAELGVTDRLAYLNTGTFGPLPRRSLEAMAAADRLDFERGRTGSWYPEEVLALREALRAGFESLLGAPPGSIALTRSTSEGCAIVCAGLGLGPGDEVVTTDAEHFGLLGPLAASGARVRLARVEEAAPGTVLAAVEAQLTPATALIAVSHVTWTAGELMPLAELAGLGVPLLVDGAQAVGAIPVSLAETGADFYAFSGQKWLLGPGSTGGLFVAPGRLEALRVRAPSYYAQAGYDATGAFEPRPGAARFDSGWLPPSTLAGMAASLAFAEEAGETRFGRARAQAARCRELMAERVEVVSSRDAATLVSWRSPDAAVEARGLADRGLVVRQLPIRPWVRASVGFWTSDEEIELLADAVAGMRATPEGAATAPGG